MKLTLKARNELRGILRRLEYLLRIAPTVNVDHIERDLKTAIEKLAKFIVTH